MLRLVITLITAALLGGCIVLPAGHSHWDGGHGHRHYGGHHYYYDGPSGDPWRHRYGP